MALFSGLPVLSGQNVDMSKGRLTLAPRFDVPYVVPVMILMCEAQLSAAASTPTMVGAGGSGGTEYTLLVGFGALALPANGLVVSGCKYPNTLNLEAGQSVKWRC